MQKLSERIVCLFKVKNAINSAIVLKNITCRSVSFDQVCQHPVVLFCFLSRTFKIHVVVHVVVSDNFVLIFFCLLYSVCPFLLSMLDIICVSFLHSFII